MEPFAWRTSDVCSGQVRDTSAVWIRRAKIRQVRHHGDVVLMPFHWHQAFGQSDIRKPSCLVGIKCILGEAKSAAKKHDSFGRSRACGLCVRKRLQKRNGHH